MVRQIHLPFVPVTWSQTLTHEGATILRARMKWKPHVRCELKLRDDTELAQHEVELTILDGEIRAEDRIKYKLVEEAIGGLWFVDDKDFAALVHGWFFVTTTVYDAIWDEVRQDGYTGCNFSLDVGPVEGKGFVMRGGATTRSRSSAHQSALTASHRLMSNPREEVGLGADGGDRC